MTASSTYSPVPSFVVVEAQPAMVATREAANNMVAKRRAMLMVNLLVDGLIKTTPAYLPYCALAADMQLSLVAPANASHFSRATWYSAVRLSSRASARASMAFLSALASASVATRVALAWLMQTS